MDAVLKETVKSERDRLEETEEYGLLSQNNESSALLITTPETHAGLLVQAVAAESPSRRAQTVNKLQNSTFYVIKLVFQDLVLHAIRRTSSGWKTKRALSTRSIFFSDNRLDLDVRPSFELEKTVDFFICGDEILILNKGRFESTLRYKQAHAEDFLALQGEAEFASLFVDVAPLIQHVGSNKIQLRRMCAVRQKAHYRDDAFMERVRQHHAEYGFTLEFDGKGKIIVTPETGAEVITALLDHRLASGFSERVYDVPSAIQVAV